MFYAEYDRGGGNSLYLEKEIKNLKKDIENLKEIIEQLSNNTYSLSGGIQLHDNANLNDYSDVGNYYCPSSASVQTMQNCPTTNAFTLKVEKSTGNAYSCQTLRDFHFGTLYYRYINSGQWTAWKSLTPV